MGRHGVRQVKGEPRARGRVSTTGGPPPDPTARGAPRHRSRTARRKKREREREREKENGREKNKEREKEKREGKRETPPNKPPHGILLLDLMGVDNYVCERVV